MPDTPPPSLAGSATGDGQALLNAEIIERTLADFRSWLEACADLPSAPVEPAETVDLHTLLAQFVGLRHEVNLQTKAARTQQEQNNQLLEQLKQAAAELESERARQKEGQSQEEAFRPLLKAIVDARDALALAQREVQRVRTAVLPLLTAQAASDPQGQPSQPRVSIWQRFLGRGRGVVAERDGCTTVPDPQAVGRIRLLIESVLTGYTMSLQRLERTVQQCGLEEIRCLGQAFDPEQMEVVAVVHDSDRPPGEVVEELRRGYRWHGRVFRYAQVSVTRT
jgi:molecular chaperone GrpE